MTMYVLLIENSALPQAESLMFCLENEGYQVCTAHTPETVVARLKTCWPNLIVFNPINLDQTMVAFHQALNEITLNIPYLILGDAKFPSSLPPATNTYVTAANQAELLQTIKAIEVQQRDRFIRLANLVIDCHQYQLLRGETQHSLTPKEFKLLHLLLKNSDQVLSRKTIMQQVWETDYLGDTRTLDVHIRWLREKIEQNPSQPRHLLTVRGVGYHFVTEPD
ncbi:MAG: response regulator transcription factor [Chloroflexota bacterium]